MKHPTCLVLALGFCLGGLYAADKPPTAFEVLKEARKKLGEPVSKNLLRMESEYARLRPRHWWVRFYDADVTLKVRALYMIGSEMNRNITPGNIFDGGNAEFIINPEQLKYDSEKCIAFIQKACKDSNIPLQSLHVRLEKPHPGESNPIWYFELLDAQEEALGRLSISATTGRVTEIVGLKLKDTRFKPVSKSTLSQDVEETFIGIGADLEEFFTGKRSLDKDQGTEPEPKPGSED